MKHLLIIFLLLLSTITLAQTGKIEGIVHDAQTNKPLAFANIIIKGTNKGTTTDIDGKFILDKLKPGYLILRMSYIGYSTKFTNEILISNSSAKYLDVSLERNPNLLLDIIVKANPFRKSQESPISMQRIGVKEIESSPGSNRDILRVLQVFTGVSTSLAYRNDVIVRGGGPSENRFFLDGVEIPILNHFSTQGASGGPVGIINADFIKNVDFYSAAFPADKYNALSSVFDFKQKDGSMDKTNVQFTLGASEAAITLDGPIGKKTNYIFSVRRSYLQFLFSVLQLPFLPTYNDYQLRLKTNFDSKNQLTIISIGSLDKMKLNKDIDDPDPSQQNILSYLPVNNQWSYTIGAVYKHFFKDGFHTFVLSRNVLDNKLYKYPENDKTQVKTFDYDSKEIENKLRYEFDILKNGFRYVASVNIEFANYTNTTTQQVFLLDKLEKLNYHTDFDMLKYGFSFQTSGRIFNDKLLTSIGVRFDGNDFNSNTSNIINQFSPRISFSYTLTSYDNISLGFGRYFQLPAYTTMGYRDNEGHLLNEHLTEYIGLSQYNLGFEHVFSEKILLSVEGFYKDYFNYPIDMTTGSSLANQGADFDVYGANLVSFSGKGRAYGLELLNRWDYDTFSLLASYTFFYSSFTNDKGKYIASSWDSRHILTITGTKNLKKNWKIGAKWRFVGGSPYTPYDLEKSSEITVWNVKRKAYLDYSQLNAKRFKPFHQLDLRVDKNYYFKNWTLMFYLDVQNVYNFKSNSQDVILREKNTDGSFKTINNGQNYVLKSYPNDSGTILPTLGVMVKF